MKLYKQDIPFTMIANEVLYRTDISLKAKGVFAYLFSKPDGWDFSGDRIVTEMKDGRKAVFSALKEIERVGLLKRKKQPDGRMDYTIEYAESQMSKMGNRLFPVVQRGQLGSISNKDIYIKKGVEKSRHIDFVRNLPEADTKELAEKFSINIKLVKKIAEDLVDYCEAKGRIYKNYKAALRTFIKKHLERHPEARVKVEKPVVREKEPELSAEERRIVEERKREIRERMSGLKTKMTV